MPNGPPKKSPPPPPPPSKGGWHRVPDRIKAMLSPSWWVERHHRWAVAVAVLVLIGIGAIVAYQDLRRPPDVLNEDVGFSAKEAKQQAKTVNWPLYGYDRRRTRYLPAKGIKPPFKEIWDYVDKPLLEFAPIYAGGRVFGLDNNGHAFAIDADTGKVLWKRRPGRLNASAPTYANKRLFIVNLVPGQIVALNVENGKTEWRKELGSRAESSPVVVGNRVFFGDEGGNLFAVDRRNGHTIWTAQLCGAIKAAPAYQHGFIYVGDYGGCMNAVNAHSGKIKWQSSSQGLGLGTSGAFYSTPAVSFGRVYSGNNDHRVYSFSAADGTLAWSHSTGSYVYSGPAVADTPRTGPTVYIGSVDGNVYALNAKTGETRWYRYMGGEVIGSVSAVGNIVYAGTYNNTTTYGFDMKNGHQVFRFPTGGANSPVISDGHRLYLTGYSSISALQPLTKKQLRKQAQAKKARAKRKKARQQRRQQHKRQAQQHKQGQKGKQKTKSGGTG
jgi:outer membrane protein assembly factor BamB